MIPTDRTTILVVGEGDTECAFLRHLKSQVKLRGERSISIRNAHGGSPDIVLTYAKRNTGGFDKVAILVDGDQLEEDIVVFQQRAAKSDIKAMVVCPCIEALFLSLFDPCHDWSTKSTAEAKRLLHEKYFDDTEEERERRIWPSSQLLQGKHPRTLPWNSGRTSSRNARTVGIPFWRLVFP